MLRSVSLVCFLAFSGLALAEDPVFVTEEGAIRGYDPVAYHVDGKPVPGKPDITYRWQGAQWHFASVANRDAFARDPAKYAPQYGGFCAFGTSRGYKVSTEPEAFAIVDGKLYLNHNLEVQEYWDQDRPGNIDKADANWVDIADDPYETE